jgi:CHAT domain-containing protein
MVASYRRNPDDRELGAELYRLLVAPAVDSLPNERPIAVVPDKALHTLPFAMLRDSSRKQYLIEMRALTVALMPFARDAASTPVVRNAALVVGNPTVAARFRAEFPTLRASEQEARAIAALYSSPTLFIAADATKERFLAGASTHPVVHFGGHGVANDRNAGASALFFAPGRDDGVVYARELGALSLRHVDVMVLAGCNTADGKSFDLEGLSGVARAALGSGARHVVATLGAIDDEASSYLFRRFHAGIAAGQTPANALRAVQIEMLRSGKPDLARPAAWGLVQVMTAGV